MLLFLCYINWRKGGIAVTKNRRKIILIFSLFNSLIILSTALFCIVFKPENIIENGKTYTCIFQKLFNFYCPGCGGTRSLAYLLSFDFKNSFLYYPPIIIGLLLVFYFNIILIFAFKKNSLSIINRFDFLEFLIIPISVFLTFFIRNILLLFGIDFIGDILL